MDRRKRHAITLYVYHFFSHQSSFLSWIPQFISLVHFIRWLYAFPFAPNMTELTNRLTLSSCFSFSYSSPMQQHRKIVQNIYYIYLNKQKIPESSNWYKWNFFRSRATSELVFWSHSLTANPFFQTWKMYFNPLRTLEEYLIKGHKSLNPTFDGFLSCQIQGNVMQRRVLSTFTSPLNIKNVIKNRIIMVSHQASFLQLSWLHFTQPIRMQGFEADFRDGLGA